MLLPSGVKIILPLVNTEPHTRFNRYERFGGIIIKTNRTSQLQPILIKHFARGLFLKEAHCHPKIVTTAERKFTSAPAEVPNNGKELILLLILILISYPKILPYP